MDKVSKGLRKDNPWVSVNFFVPEADLLMGATPDDTDLDIDIDIVCQALRGSPELPVRPHALCQ